MVRKLTTAQARRQWANVLRTASHGNPVVVTSNGHPLAAVVSIEQLHAIEHARPETLAEAIMRARSKLDPDELAGPDPWANVRDRSPGRDVHLD
jgi:prevent-host-death family protein